MPDSPQSPIDPSLLRGDAAEVVTDLDVDLLKPPEDRPFEFVGRLVFNQFVRPGEEYVAKAGRDVVKWRQVFEALDVVRPDGTPAQFTNSPTIGHYDEAGNFVKAGGPEPAYYVLAKAWQGVVGHPLDPRDARSEQLLGHVFRLRSHRVGRDRFAVRILLPTEHLGGPDYQWTGEVRTIRQREGGEGDGAPSFSLPQAAPVPTPSDTGDGARQIADLLDYVPNEPEAVRKKLTGFIRQLPAKVGDINVVDDVMNADGRNLVAALIEQGLLRVDENGVLRRQTA